MRSRAGAQMRHAMLMCDAAVIRLMQYDNLFYRLEVVSERAARMEMRSPRGAVSWEQAVPVDRLVHDELALGESSPMRQARIRQITRSSAWNHYIEYLSRAALNAGMEWAALNLRGSDRGFLFSTRRQTELEEAFGENPELIDREGFRVHVAADRSIPPEVCYCVKTGNARIFARYEPVGARLRIYLSDVTRSDTGQNIAQAEASSALRYLKSLELKLSEPEEEPREEPERVRPPARSPAPSFSGALAEPARIPSFQWRPERVSEQDPTTEDAGEDEHSAEEAPKAVTEEPSEEPSDEEEPGGGAAESADTVIDAVEDIPTQVPGGDPSEAADGVPHETTADALEGGSDSEKSGLVCPDCADDLFHIAGPTCVCLSCGWSNLPELESDLEDEQPLE